MSVETDIVAAIGSVVAAVFPAGAPAGTDLPYVIWQRIGGRSLRYLDGEAPGERHVSVQVTVWAATRGQANALALAIEDALVGAPALTVEVEGEPLDDFEPDLTPPRYGATQDFTVLGTR